VKYMAKEMLEKIPPRSIEAEKAFLGCLMINPESINKVIDYVEVDDFYKKAHQDIYRVCQELFEKGESIDILNCANRLKEKNLLEDVGGNSYLTELINTVPTATHILSYADTVRGKKVLRDLIGSGTDIAFLGYNESESSEKLLDQAESLIFSISQKGLRHKFTRIKEELGEAFERIDRLWEHKGELRGLPTGFNGLDNILAGFQKSDLIILASRPSMGKCIAGNTKIISSNPGSLSTVEKVVKNKNENVFTLNNNLKIAKTKASNFIDNGKKDVFLLKTDLGREIEVTINHPFLTISGWKPLGRIKIGERIAVPRKIPVFGKTILPAFQIKTLAYLIAEGGLTNQTPRFTNGNKTIIKDFLQSVRSFPAIRVRKDASKKAPTYSIAGIKDKESEQKIKQLSKKIKDQVKKFKITNKALIQKTGLSYVTISQTLNGHSLPFKKNFLKILDLIKASNKSKKELLKEYENIVYKNRLTEWLKSLGLMGKLAKEKAIPGIIFTLNKQGLSLFINRLFACDGSFWIDKMGNHHLSYASSSKELIQSVQHLLLRFGVVSKVRKKKIKYNNDIKISYELEIHNSKNLLTFIKEISILGKERKLSQAKKILSQKKICWTQDTLPIEIWGEIIKAKGEKSWYSIYPKLGLPRTHNIHAFRRNPRRETVAKLAELFHSQKLKNLSESDIYWDKIVSVKYLGKKQVYDLTIPGTHNFIANDFIVHNSALAMNIATQAAIQEKKSVAIFSLEMSKDQLIDRLIADQAGIDLWKLRTGKVSKDGEDNDFARIQRALGVLSEASIYIDDAATCNILQMRAMARRLQAKEGLDLIIVDYLQLIEPRNTQAPIVQQMTEISRSLKSLARELSVPVLALSQLSRAVEQRTPQKPRLSDLRETGAIEQDADVVMFIYREDRYRQDTERKNIADIIIAKHRNGPVGNVELYFDETRVAFKNLEKNYTDYNGEE
jgi:replicative DNA helicase